MERAGIPLNKLRADARDLGNTAWVQAALGERDPENDGGEQLANGYAS